MIRGLQGRNYTGLPARRPVENKPNLGGSLCETPFTTVILV